MPGKIYWGVKLAAAALILVGIGVFLLSHFQDKENEKIFQDLHGPIASSVIATPAATKWEDFKSGDRSRLAILLLDTDSAWLGIAHGLKSIGIPFIITRSYKEALQHQVVLAYPLRKNLLNLEIANALTQFTSSGGALIGINVGEDSQQIFGLKKIIPSNARYDIKLNDHIPITNIFKDRSERSIHFSSKTSGKYVSSSYGYSGTFTSIAQFDDGSSAITARKNDQGTTYAIGLDLGSLLLTGYNNGENGVSRNYVGGYEPTLDLFLRFIKEIYKTHEPLAVTLGSVPNGKSLSAIITHDVDYGPAMQHALIFANLEKSLGIKSTYFIQTKYIQDWNDVAFFNSSKQHIDELTNLGMEIGSHSVSHSLHFNAIPLGTGHETYPQYRPYVRNKDITENASIFGELRISRFLLEHFLPNHQITSFRAGYLRIPYYLSQVLESTGYKFDSSITANHAMSHLPFRLANTARQNSQTSIFEFPITVEDQSLVSHHERLTSSLHIADRLAEYGGLFVMLVHPDAQGDRLNFVTQWIKANQERAWFGTLRDFGEFWSARDHTAVDVRSDDGILKIYLNAPEIIHGLVLNVPEHYQLTASSRSDANLSQISNQVILKALKGKAMISMMKKPGVTP